MNIPVLYAVRHFVKDWRSQIASCAQQYPFPATSAGMLFVKKEEESCESVERDFCQSLNRARYLGQWTTVCRTLQVRKALYRKFDRLISRAVPKVGCRRPPEFEGVVPVPRSRASEGGILTTRFVLRK